MGTCHVVRGCKVPVAGFDLVRVIVGFSGIYDRVPDVGKVGGWHVGWSHPAPFHEPQTPARQIDPSHPDSVMVGSVESCGSRPRISVGSHDCPEGKCGLYGGTCVKLMLCCRGVDSERQIRKRKSVVSYIVAKWTAPRG